MDGLAPSACGHKEDADDLFGNDHTGNADGALSKDADG